MLIIRCVTCHNFTEIKTSTLSHADKIIEKIEKHLKTNVDHIIDIENEAAYS